jgi:ferritin-like metal-binding protein YciE
MRLGGEENRQPLASLKYKNRVMAVQNMETFTAQLQKLWSIESQLVEAMPRMIQKANNFGLQKILALHFEETRQQKVAIEVICKQLDIDPKASEPDSGIMQILQDGERQMINAASENDVDAAIIEGAQKIEEYEIAAYMPAGRAAQALGYKGVAGRLFLTLEEERQSDTKLKFLEKALFIQTAEIGQITHQSERT